MDAQARLQQLLRELREPLRPLAQAMAQQSHWDLNLVAAVIDARRQPPQLIATRVGTINSVIKVSATIAAEPLQRFFSLLEQLDFAQAFEVCASDPEQGEAFVEAFEAYCQERTENGQALWSVEDSTAFVLKSRDCFTDQELPLVALLPAEEREGMALFSFGVPLAFLLGSDRRGSA